MCAGEQRSPSGGGNVASWYNEECNVLYSVRKSTGGLLTGNGGVVYIVT